MQIELRIEKIQKTVCVLRACIKRLNKQQVKMKIAYINDLKKMII